MAFLQPLTANTTPHPALCCVFSEPEVAEEAVLHVGCLSALADRYSDAGACERQKHFSLTTHMRKHSPHHRCVGVQARCKINGYRQLKGGLKGGLIPL